MKKKNSGTFIPIRIVGSKVQMRVPNRNPGTLKQISNITKRLNSAFTTRKAPTGFKRSVTGNYYKDFKSYPSLNEKISLLQSKGYEILEVVETKTGWRLFVAV